MDITVNDFLKRAVATAEHFGFRSNAHHKGRTECKNCKVPISHTAKVDDRRLDGIYGLLAGGINAYTSSKLHGLDEPVFYYNLEEVPRTGDAAITFHIFNVEKSIAEAILIQTVRSLFNEVGQTNHVVKINSLGDNDSRTRYARELNTFLRKRLNELPPAARELMKEHVTLALSHMIEKNHELALRSPSPLEHLSDTSRRHFREIVEYLDMSETPYEIEPKLLGHYQCFNDAIFSFELQDGLGNSLEEKTLQAQGGRYTSFFEKHLKQTVPAVGAVVILKGKRQPARLPKQGGQNPAIHIIQLGFAPKIRSLLLIDELRREGILVNQNLTSDSLSTQLRQAEETGAKYSIIIGQKEYVDGTVIFRDMIGKNQETIPQSTLVSRLKRVHA
ncbi:hypothetical protein COU14_01910 [Candidatus Kaiserbacteria bacterium CG10_big_fil_rev_8_21_14_0_10_44_10]|uniref:Histidyl-tRNA synthetase n=1 Tax=Candidatus Kaiserbacteria bacterium CG10_big_fil_rev_8_21_14_0_10_44_10 TaxID=1974606 RepID=A0A2H0UHP8_9BACT|nr:MAG: hypothetical protein COU14_01910 [Candidatus Kaiserbacteria bacterium CG10_big_fil_rev_8_21_14_0_10_44_10]